MEKLEWLPANSAPKDGRKVVLRISTGALNPSFAKEWVALGYYWDGEWAIADYQTGLELISDKDVLGWVPIPPISVPSPPPSASGPDA